MEQTKSLFESKVFWLAVGQAALGAVVSFATAYPGVGWLMIAKSVLDIALRLATTTTIVGVAGPQE